MRSASNSNRSAASNRFYTIPQASRELGIPSYKLRRAVKLGVIPGHSLLDGRLYVRIEDIQDAMVGQTSASPKHGSFGFNHPEGGSL